MCHIASTETCRTMAPCAARAILPRSAHSRPARGRGRSEFGGFGRGFFSTWDHGLGGCESGFTLPDPTDTNIVWATCYGDEVTRYDYTTKMARSVSPWLHTLDSEPNVAKYRCHWTPPMAIDPFDHNIVYYGCQVIFRTSNGGKSWSVISPDLSTQDPSRIVSSGGIVGDNLGQFYGEVVFSIAPSDVQKGPDLGRHQRRKGLVHKRRRGASGTMSQKTSPGMPAWGVISKIQPSHFDAGTAYIAVDLHLMDNRDPFIFKTTDFGQTWTKISDGLPKGPLAYARVITENPNRKGMLFAGTGNALYYSMDDGGNWKQLKDGLPPSPVSWIVVQKNYHDLVVSTYGRGFYILEDLTPLEQPETRHGGVRALLSSARNLPSVARRARLAELFAQGTSQGCNQAGDSRFARQGDSRDEGRQGTSRDSIACRGICGTKSRNWWSCAPRLRKIRTSGKNLGSRKAQTRPITHWGLQPAEVGPIAAPGKYTARLTVDGQTYTAAARNSAASLEPRLGCGSGSVSQTASEGSRRYQQRRGYGEPDRMDAQAAGGYAESRWRNKRAKEALLKAMNAIDQKMQEVEYKLITRADALSDDKYFQTAYKLYMNFIWLNGEIGTGAGDVAGSADYGPTETSIGLVLGLENQLHAVQAEYKSLMEKDVPAYNSSLSGSGINPLTATPPPAPAAPASEPR